MSLEEKRQLIEPEHEVSIVSQAALLELNRSSVYYTPVPISNGDLALMRRIDEIHTKSPCYGRRTIHAQLVRDGYSVGERHVGSLMESMGIEAIYPHPNISKPEPGHKIYPYLLKGVKALYPDHIWAYDITYIPLLQGFMYLCAIIDWFSRYVIAWKVEERMDVGLVISCWEDAFQTGHIPYIANSDQGSQMTASDTIKLIRSKGILISMDHKGRCFDNIFTERLWRSVKYEEVYLTEYETPKETRIALNNYFTYYNEERLHASLAYATPKEIYINR